MELIFSIAAHIVQCFGFVAKMVLITQKYFGYCWIVLAQHQSCLFLPLYTPSLPHPKQVGWGGQEVERAYSQDSLPKLDKGLFCTI